MREIRGEPLGSWKYSLPNLSKSSKSLMPTRYARQNNGKRKQSIFSTDLISVMGNVSDVNIDGRGEGALRFGGRLRSGGGSRGGRRRRHHSSQSRRSRRRRSGGFRHCRSLRRPTGSRSCGCSRSGGRRIVGGGWSGLLGGSVRPVGDGRRWKTERLAPLPFELFDGG